VTDTFDFEGRSSGWSAYDPRPENPVHRLGAAAAARQTTNRSFDWGKGPCPFPSLLRGGLRGLPVKAKKSDMKAIKKWNEVTKSVDARVLKNGKTRLRFRLSPEGLAELDQALTLAKLITGYETKGALLEVVAMSYLSGNSKCSELDYPHKGRERVLIRLFPDQYSMVRLALNQARIGSNSDAEALLKICREFVTSETPI